MRLCLGHRRQPTDISKAAAAKTDSMDYVIIKTHSLCEPPNFVSDPVIDTCSCGRTEIKEVDDKIPKNSHYYVIPIFPL